MCARYGQQSAILLSADGELASTGRADNLEPQGVVRGEHLQVVSAGQLEARPALGRIRARRLMKLGMTRSGTVIFQPLRRTTPDAPERQGANRFLA